MPKTKPRIAPAIAAEISGDPRDLLTSIGEADAHPGISAVVSATGLQQVKDLSTLDAFLGRYIQEILLPVELPAVLGAWRFTEDCHARELIDLDRNLLLEPRLESFKAASCAVGRRQLSKLRPLRDHRVIQRYLTAMADGKAAAWHTLVYGLLTSVYSIPLRQSLTQLAQQTLAGFTLSATLDFSLKLDDGQKILADHFNLLSNSINQLIDHSPASIGTAGPRLVAI